MITKDDWRDRKVDARCRDCGATSAGGFYCYRCTSKNVELRLHSEFAAGEAFWCGTGVARAPQT